MKKKILLIILITFILGSITFILCKPSKIPILGYHSFTVKESTEFKMNINKFESQMKYLYDHNYKTISPDELYNIYQNKKIPKKTIMITFDDGYQSNYELALPILKKYNLKATIFIIGYNTISNRDTYMNIDTINKIKEEYPNITIASHSYNLHEDGVIGKNRNELIKDFNKMKEVIDTKYFAYPYGLHNEEVENILKEEGYKLAFTFGPSKEHRRFSLKDSAYEIPRLNISGNMPMYKFIFRLNFM